MMNGGDAGYQDETLERILKAGGVNKSEDTKNEVADGSSYTTANNYTYDEDYPPRPK